MVEIITTNYFDINEAYPEAHFILATDQTKHLCKMAQLYQMISLKEYENFTSAITSQKQTKQTKQKHKIISSNNISYTLAQKILSPLTRRVELEWMPQELIDFIKQISTGFKLLCFPNRFSHPDKKKIVRLNLILKDTLLLDTYWSFIPFTKLNLLSNTRNFITHFMNDIFKAVFSNYTSGITIIACKDGFSKVSYAEDIQQVLRNNH